MAFQPEYELAHFDLKRVDTNWATFTWKRKVGKTGQISIRGHHHYYLLGQAYACKEILVRFDPADRCFIFSDPDAPDVEIGR
ncbi:MAG: hypothetical protein AB1531_06140 [Chloroflexota bacterium]